MKENVFLDTNIFYLISNIQGNKKYDIDSIKTYVQKNNCFCSFISLFEILNTDSFSEDEKKIVLEYIEEHKIIILYPVEILDEVNKLITSQKKDSNFYKSVYGILGNYIIKSISSNISFCIMSYLYCSATLYVDNYEAGLSIEKQYFRQHFSRLQKPIDKYIRSLLIKHFTNLLRKNEFKADKNQDVLLLFIANIMTYYYEWLRRIKELFESKDPNAYYKTINIFKKLKNKILKDEMQDNIDYDYKYLSICRILIEQLTNNENYEPDINKGKALKPKKIKEYLMNKIKSSYFFVDKNMSNAFEITWIEKILRSLMIESAKIKFNDFTDYEILRDFYYSPERDVLITTDDNIYKIMKDSVNIGKFAKSIKMIDGFKI